MRQQDQSEETRVSRAVSQDAEYETDGPVDFSCLRGVKAAGEVAQPAGVNRAELIDEHTGPVPSISISGQKIAGCALVDVGATISVERGIP